MNTRRLNTLRLTAKRSLAILDLIEQGLPWQEIAEKTGSSRQLVQYYIKLLNTKG